MQVSGEAGGESDKFGTETSKSGRKKGAGTDDSTAAGLQCLTASGGPPRHH